jgi:hypothetical protein
MDVIDQITVDEKTASVRKVAITKELEQYEYQETTAALILCSNLNFHISVPWQLFSPKNVIFSSWSACCLKTHSLCLRYCKLSKVLRPLHHGSSVMRFS